MTRSLESNIVLILPSNHSVLNEEERENLLPHSEEVSIFGHISQ